MSETATKETKPRKITKSNITKKEMKDFLVKGLKDKTVKKKEYNEFLKSVGDIVSRDIDNKAQLKETREAFWKMFGDRVAPTKKNVKKSNPLYNMFADVSKEVDKEG